jgi:hypothetical protein
LGEGSPRPEQGLLKGVLGVVEGAEHPIAVGVEFDAMSFDQSAKRVLVATLGCGKK